MTTEQLKNRLAEIKSNFGKTVFFGMAEADEMMSIEAELIKRGELYQAVYSED